LLLVGGLARREAGAALAAVLGLPRAEGKIAIDPQTLLESAHPAVLVDLSVHPASVAIARAAVERGVAVVIGATGWRESEAAALDALAQERGVGAALVPNFALGAALMMRFAAEAARRYPTMEIIEFHHDGKRDKPSGTALATARRMRDEGGREVAIHSVRLRGLVAHQEVLFGGEGETLTLRHDALTRAAFMPGLLLAIRAIGAKRGLVRGLEPFLEAAP
ncbi:MAG: 4-hydroxy-tetrahydrodipicolinate reductase, partial [Vulcanimicrobiaceae bacterium]